MLSALTTTKDGRAAYKTGGTKTQPVYARSNGEYARDANGKLVVEKYRVIRYGYVVVNGKKVKTSPVSILVPKHPDQMTGAESRALDRQLNELLMHSTAVVEKANKATEQLSELIDSESELTAANFKKIASGVTNITKNPVPTDHASIQAIEAFISEANRYAGKISDESAELQEQIDAEESFLADAPVQLQRAQDIADQKDRLQTIGMACIRYILDPDIKAGEATRRCYESYIRNHILVPTSEGVKAFGDLTIPEITKAILKAYELSFYKEREGFKYVHQIAKPESWIAIKAHITEGKPYPVLPVHQIAVSPSTVQKLMAFLSSVIEWTLAEPEKWGLETYGINIVSKYKMMESSASTRKQYAPRTAEFHELVTAAKELNLHHMIPLMALTRCTFRPSESRGIRWSDVSKVNLYGKTWDAAILQGTVRFERGKGEHWVGEGKTKDSLGNTVVIPASIMKLLEEHRVEGCEYVVPPVPNTGGKNSDRIVKPFLTKDAYAEGWAKIKSKVGLPTDTDMYTLKHGMIAELLMKGFKPEQICLMTRHTTTEMINRVYGALNSGDLAQAIDDMHSE